MLHYKSRIRFLADLQVTSKTCEGIRVLRKLLRLFNKHQSVDVTDALAREAGFNPALARRLRETEIELIQALQLSQELRREKERLEQVLRGLNLPTQMPEFLETVPEPTSPGVVNEGEVTL